MSSLPVEQRKIRNPEENINHSEDKLEVEIGLEIVLVIHKIEIEGYQEDPIGVEISLETI